MGTTGRHPAEDDGSGRGHPGREGVVHVAVETTEALRDFALGALTSDRAVAAAETHLVFEHLRGGFMA